MWNKFFKHIDIVPNNAHILDGNAQDLQKECDRYEEDIKEAGGIELFIGGISQNICPLDRLRYLFIVFVTYKVCVQHMVGNFFLLF